MGNDVGGFHHDSRTAQVAFTGSVRHRAGDGFSLIASGMSDFGGKLAIRNRSDTRSDIMEIIEVADGRLRAALIAGKIPVTDETLATLRVGLSTIGHGYHIEKWIRRRVKTGSQLRNDLSRLHTACRTVVDVLDADMRGSCQIEVILSDFWSGNQIPQVVQQLRRLCARLETALAMAAPSRG